jgi:protein-S-isoprenylcysteine O-methyltransferase Ste14
LRILNVISVEDPAWNQEDGGKLDISLVWKILLYGWTASEVIIAIATRTRSSAGKVKDRGSLIILWVTITLAITAGEAIHYGMRSNSIGGGHGLIVAAIAVLIAGIAIRWTAILSLGKAFSSNVAIRDTQTIYRHGLYRFLRHPSYTGLLLVFLAVGLQERNWIACIVIMAPTTAAVFYRIHVEEAALNEAFGAQYAAYSKQTKRLIPGVY